MSRTLADRILAANETLLEQGNADAAAEFFAPTYVAHMTDKDLSGHQWVTGFVTQLRKAFPDLTVDVDVLATGEDRVAWQRTCRATHRASFQGFPATGDTIQWRDMLVTRFEDKIAEEWALSDLAERLLAARH